MNSAELNEIISFCKTTLLTSQTNSELINDDTATKLTCMLNAVLPSLIPEEKAEDVKNIKNLNIENDIEYTCLVISKYGYLTKSSLTIPNVDGLHAEKLVYSPKLVKDNVLSWDGNKWTEAVHESNVGGYYKWTGKNMIDIMLTLLSKNYNTDNLDQKVLEDYKNPFECHYTLNIPEALPPRKSDPSGYDLYLVKRVLRDEHFDYFTTGVTIETPAKIWYQIVESDTMKCMGYQLVSPSAVSNNCEISVGIRRMFGKEITDDDLPLRWIKIVPHQWIHTSMTLSK